MKKLAIDYGRRRIGIAVSDASGTIARGLTTIDRLKKSDYLETIHAIILQENPQILVVGLPLDFDDRETEMSREVRGFAAQLKERSGLPVEFLDESFSTWRATEILHNRKRKERHDKAARDRLAACLILQEYIRIKEQSGEK